MLRLLFAGLFGAMAISAQISELPSGDMPGTVSSAEYAGESSAGQNPSPQAAPARPRAFEYSDGYFVRRKIHKYASIATAPLFISEVVVGQKLYHSTGSSSLRGVHSGLAAGIATLFVVNSVTGVWNLVEGRKDPNHRGKRLLHGLLMLGADAGFVATAALAPEGEERRLAQPNNRRSTHRAVALSSIGVATFGYLYMLLSR